MVRISRAAWLRETLSKKKKKCLPHFVCVGELHVYIYMLACLCVCGGVSHEACRPEFDVEFHMVGGESQFLL